MTCQRCGRCCCEYAITQLYREPDSEKKAAQGKAFIDMHRGSKVIEVKDVPDGIEITALVTSTCEHLGTDAEGRVCCRIYDERPSVCRKFQCDRCE